ncbi:MAG: hypothetical protein QM820_61390 [Minicystis sp.]
MSTSTSSAGSGGSGGNGGHGGASTVSSVSSSTGMGGSCPSLSCSTSVASSGAGGPFVNDAGSACAPTPTESWKCGMMFADAGALYAWNCGLADSGPTPPDPALGCYFLGDSVFWCCP